MAGIVVPAAFAASFNASSQATWSGLMMEGAVGPTGFPKIQLMPMRISDTPMIRMIDPVTTGGKNRNMRLTSGAIRMPKIPAPIIEPNIRRAPSAPGALPAMATMGATDAKVTPIITGRRMPNHWVAPKDWIKVTRPQQNKSAEIRKATSSGGSFSARPTMSGTATAPAYMTRTCWIPRAANRGAGRTSSTACVDDIVFPFCVSHFFRSGRLFFFAPCSALKPKWRGANIRLLETQTCFSGPPPCHRQGLQSMLRE